MATHIFRKLFKRKVTYLLSVSLRKYCSQTILNTDIHNVVEEVSKLSTLFVPGRYGHCMYQIVKPFVDIDYIANNLENLKLSCNQRGIELDLDYTLNVAREWLNLKNNFATLVDKDQKYISELIQLKELNSEQKLEILNKKRKELEDEIINEKHKVHDIEDIVMPLLQRIPHILHPNTPLRFNVINVNKEPSNLGVDIKSHLQIAKSLSLLEFINNSPTCYFLKGKLSEIDLATQMYFMNKMNSLGFLPLSCMDFCKSFIIEAIGYDPYSDQNSILIECKGDQKIGQKLHLIGGASFETFCSYLTNMNVTRSKLPTRYFSVGRRYNAAFNKVEFLNLFSVMQSTNVHCLILCEPCSVDEFDLLLQQILICYSELNVPFRTVNVAAKNLTVSESRRIQIELWSPALKDYVPVGYVSQHDDFISKRLQITYGEEHFKEGYCSIVEGAVANISTLIGCIIENFQTINCDFNIPNVLHKYISSLYD